MFVFHLSSINDVSNQALDYYDYLMRQKCNEIGVQFSSIKDTDHEWFFYDSIWDSKILSQYNYDYETIVDIDFLNFVKNVIINEVESEIEILTKRKGI